MPPIAPFFALKPNLVGLNPPWRRYTSRPLAAVLADVDMWMTGYGTLFDGVWVDNVLTSFNNAVSKAER